VQVVMDFQRRITRFRELVSRQGRAGFLVTKCASLRYLFGFTGSNGICLITPTGAFFISDFRYRKQLQSEISGCEIIITSKSLVEGLRSLPVLDSRQKFGFEAGHITFTKYQQLHELFARIDWCPTDKLIEILAVVKDEEEIDYLRQAAELADGIFSELLPLVHPGMRESEVAAEILYRCKKNGGERAPFQPGVASGEHSVYPHGRTGDKIIDAGELLTHSLRELLELD